MRATKPPPNLTDISARIASFRAPVADELSLVDRELRRILPNGGGLIDEVADHLLSSKGKRFRPTLLLLSARMAGDGAADSCLAASVIVELVHMATLVHDDAIDKSEIRRGKPTVNTRWNEQVSIIMGDYVYTKVFKVLADLRMFKVMDILARSTHEMTIGEMAQIEKKNNLKTTEEEYMTVIDNKTASLIGAACEIGAAVGGAGEREVELCASFGRRVGLAFQIMDDILDFLGDERVLGKPRCGDVRGGDITLPLISALRNAPEPDRSRLEELITRAGSVEGMPDDEEMIDLMQKHEGFSYAKAAGARHAESAKEFLMQFEPSPSRDALLFAAEYVVERDF